jgi:deazaflavin-dependent oxidoreductase (nitroreductase family)
LSRRSGGRIVRRWFGMPVLILETVGRRTGKPRATPVIYMESGDDLVVIAAAGGSDKPPAWWLNLEAAGEGTAVVGGERRQIRPRVTEGDERERLWREFAKGYPTLDEYTTFTDRQIPVVVLSRR